MEGTLSGSLTPTLMAELIWRDLLYREWNLQTGQQWQDCQANMENTAGNNKPPVLDILRWDSGEEG